MQGHVHLRSARAPPRMRTEHKPPQAKRPEAERPEALQAFWVRIHRHAWMTEEAARAHKRRSLLQDNPTSG